MQWQCAHWQRGTFRTFALPTDVLPTFGTIGFGVNLAMPDGASSTVATSKLTRVVCTPTAVDFKRIGRTPYVITDKTPIMFVGM